MRRHQQVPAHNYHCDDRVAWEEDENTYITRLEKKTSMAEGPHFGTMQYVFERKDKYEEVDEEEESEVVGRFGRSTHTDKHGRRGQNYNACEEQGRRGQNYNACEEQGRRRQNYNACEEQGRHGQNYNVRKEETVDYESMGFMRFGDKRPVKAT